jgi:hypothetical protein
VSGTIRPVCHAPIVTDTFGTASHGVTPQSSSLSTGVSGGIRPCCCPPAAESPAPPAAAAALARDRSSAEVSSHLHSGTIISGKEGLGGRSGPAGNENQVSFCVFVPNLSAINQIVLAMRNTAAPLKNECFRSTWCRRPSWLWLRLWVELSIPGSRAIAD